MKSKDESEDSEHAKFSREDEEEKMPVVTDAHAVENPWAVVIVASYTAATAAAVFTPNGTTCHACCAEIGVIEAPG